MPPELGPKYLMEGWIPNVIEKAEIELNLYVYNSNLHKSWVYVTNEE